ncbi:MAG: ABC transporter substrate-binding protein [Helicobacter sp.]|nr:ABC transporter substrate-binding protein [Helicobacter sp.]
MKKIFCCIYAFVAFAFANAEELRLVVLDPASVETLFMLESGDKIVGIANLQHSSIYPQEMTSKINSVGTFSNPSVEKIVQLKPNLVILSSYSLNLEAELKKFGIKSLYLKAEKLEDIQSNIQTLSQLVHKEKEGERLLKNFNQELEQLKENPIGKSAFYLYSSNPLMAFSDNSLMSDILNLIGIINLSPKSEIERFIVSSEFIAKAKPDILILGLRINDIKSFKEANPLLKNTPAFKNSAIFFNPNTYILLRLSPKITGRIAEFKTRIIQEKF